MQQQRSLQRFVSTLAASSCVIPLLSVIFFVIPEVTSGKRRPWIFALATGLVLLAVVPTWQYLRHRNSVQALYRMKDALSIAFGLVSLLGMVEMAYAWGGNFRLYRAYWFAYVTVFVAICLHFTVIRRGDYGRSMERQSRLLAEYADVGQIDPVSLYDLMTLKRGAKEALETIDYGRIALRLSPVAAMTPLLGYWLGEGIIIFACFLLFLIISPILIGNALRRRLHMWRYLRHRDVLICES